MHARSFLLVAFAFALVPAARAQIGMCTSANDTQCYRFVCNGMDAGGNISQSCNSCSDSTAPRWYQATVPVRVDRTTVPPSLTASEWSAVVNGAFAGWANVSTSNLVLQDVGAATLRGFGDGNTQHEIFWITNYNEWQQKVGSGANGALGVTIPLYFCGSPGQIYDADLVMNGVGFDNWVPTSADCTSGYCDSARSTLLHELGHFIGIGHPCSLCSWSVMSAQAGYDPEYPLAVDQAALSALYPGEPGGLGYGCNGDGDCNPGLDCITANDIEYCSQPCGECPDGFACEAVQSGGNYCVFSAGELAGAVGEGESCTQRPCEEGLLCVGGGGEYYCSRPCNPNGGNTCPDGYSCFALQGGGGACFSTTEAQVGQPCDGATTVCVEGAICVAETATSGVCRRECDGNTEVGCSASEQCIPLVDQNNNIVAGACYPYGTVQEGGSCNDPLDCARGHVCLIDGPNNSAHCYRRCDGEFSCASDTQQCTPLTGADLSYCSPLNTGDGGNNNDANNNDAGPTPDGGGNHPPPAPAGSCHLARGNFDCPNGEGCVDDGNGDELGVCEPGEEGDIGTGGLCEEDADCTGGLCVNGVCTRSCDFGCLDGYECDEDDAPGGICRPKSCYQKEEICGEGYTCQYSSAKRYVCAVGAPDEPICNCSAAPSGDSDAGNPTVALFGLSLLGVLMARRRRRCASCRCRARAR